MINTRENIASLMQKIKDVFTIKRNVLSKWKQITLILKRFKNIFF